MIDLIILVKNNLSSEEIQRIVEHNKLQTNSKGGKVYYDNIKNLQGGLYMKIETGNKLKISVSLHKYRNMLDGNGFVNFDMFTMKEASKTAKRLESETGVLLSELNVYGYEIGLNLHLSKDCRVYLDKLESIGILNHKKVFWVNPKFKNERLKTTYLYREMRKVFKAYDKNFEMKEKHRKEVTGHANILRIETVFNRVEKMPMKKFLSVANIENMTNRFIKDWRTVQFKIYTNVPAGTSAIKRQLCNDILTHGADEVLSRARTDLELKRLTPKQFRRMREFIQHEWHSFKNLVSVGQSIEEKEFRKVLYDTFDCLKH